MNDQHRDIDINEMWRAESCPILNGIIFPDGRVREVHIRSDRVNGKNSTPIIQRGNWTRLIDLNAAKPLQTTGLISLCEATDESRNLCVQGGEGGLGGDGFVAALKLDTGNLLWIAFFTESNPFVSIELYENEVLSLTNHGTCWRFPLRSPEDVGFQREC
ncbi:MAG: hypothetical protein AB7G28_11585 [Pirellulales bacterium]